MEKAGVAPDVTLRFIARKQVSVQVREPPTFETHGEGHMKSKIGAISGPTKWTLVQQTFFFKSRLEKVLCLVFRKSKDLYLIITQKLIIHEIWQISPWNPADFMVKSARFQVKSGGFHVKSDPEPYKFRCFSKNSSVWVDFTWNPPDFMWISWNPVDFMWNRKTSYK